MPRQLWIADKCREWGLDVYEEPGWETRGSSTFDPRVLVAHHTAGASRGDYPSLRVVRDGRGGPKPLPGPLSQCGLGRSGQVLVIAAGRANHAGGRYAIPYKGTTGNTSRMGIEAESVGTRDDWTPQQREKYPVLCAALLDGMGRDASYLCGHRECATNKIDPAFWHMPTMRSDVARLLVAGPRGTGITPNVQEDEMKFGDNSGSDPNKDFQRTLNGVMSRTNALGWDRGDVPSLAVDGMLGGKSHVVYVHVMGRMERWMGLVYEVAGSDGEVGLVQQSALVDFVNFMGEKLGRIQIPELAK